MIEETNTSPQTSGDNVDTDQTARTMVDRQNGFPSGDAIATGHEDPSSAVGDTSASQSNEVLAPPPQHPLPKNEISEHSQPSNFQNLDKPQNSNLDDILGPKGLPLDADLGPNGEPLESDLDDILGPQTASKLSSDLDDTLGPYEGSTIGVPLMSPSGPRDAAAEALENQSTLSTSEKRSPIVQLQPRLAVSKDSLDAPTILSFQGSRIYPMGLEQASPSRPTTKHREPTSGEAYPEYSSDQYEGGRMWREAEIEAANSKDKPLSPRAKKFAESILSRLQSRADPNALVNNSSAVESVEKPTPSMINVNEQEEGGFIRGTSTAIAKKRKKRGRIVQLLTIGLLSFLISFLGGILVLSSCFIVSGTVVGSYGQMYDLHFGLWKYTPVYSASGGYRYCTNYDGDYINSAPWMGRLSSLIAMVGGGFSLGVLFLYLVLGRPVQNVWNIAVCTAVFSGVLQLSTLSVLFGPICKEVECSLGPAGIISIVAGFFYFVLGFEMYYNTPLVQQNDDALANINCCEPPHQAVMNLDATDFKYGAKDYAKRILFGVTNPYASTHYPHTKDGENDSYVPPIV